MPLSRGVYTPPPLNQRCTIRNPADRPSPTPDAFGRPVEPESWGDEVWCHAVDRNPTEPQAEEDVLVREARTVFTIRARSGIAADAEVVFAGAVYELLASPVRRGGLGQGRLAEYMELHAQRRE